MDGAIRAAAILAVGVVVGCQSDTGPPPKTAGPSPTSDRPAFTCVGNEPGWMLSIRPDSLRFAGDYGEVVASYPGVMPRASGDSLVYESENPGGSRLTAVIVRDSCSDGMSDRVYEYRARVIHDAKEYVGCARQP